jgi:N-acetylmuramoyl-L-alanine amidase
MFSEWNTILAYCISACVKEAFPELEARGIKPGHLWVLRNNSCPSVLVEAAFMTNEKDFASFEKPEKRDELAKAMAEGIKKYEDNLKRIWN